MRKVLLTAALLLAPATAQSSTTADNSTSVGRGAQGAIQLAARLGGVENLNFATAANGTLQVSGILNGARFAARIPRDWNGTSVLYSHGYVRPDQTEPDPNATLTSLGPVVDTIVSQGFAVATSVYDKTGYAVQSGIQRTIALKRFLDRVGARKAYTIGHSMGGNIVVGLVELYPNEFVGALPLCGVVGGWSRETEYLTDFRVVYDSFTKGTKYALPGAGAIFTPNSAFTEQAVVASVRALFTDAAGGDATARNLVGAIAASTAFAADPVSFATALGGAAYGLADLFQTTGGNGYGNNGKTYGAALPEAVRTGLNAGVERFDANAAAKTRLEDWYTPKGAFKTKVLSVHNSVDPLVPVAHELAYRQTVTAAGNLANLAQQIVPTVNALQPRHCEFTPEQHLNAWSQLRAWVESGAKPQDSDFFGAR
ncbi:alpha/beta hydrolase family protein [Deinococcus yavapaiensis]|uniref:Serine aminopeptidase S33 family n=1 Tax=Deinococcus yavapaiensis KR-236 TaxID=694435 RepID=A0A318SN93_9DEIO|nr:hypothetical protein [Deinococcus yavapaiensis]PYE56362.1 hypothetical protein DES52_101166 [Deinococcus yavapaiensis KR-236]